MRSATVAALLALTLAQPGGQAYSGTWIAEMAGTTYVRLELNVTDGALGGRISLGHVRVDGQGEVSSATAAPPEFTPILSVRLRDSTLSFSRKDGDDTDQFEMRLLSDQAAELVFLPTEADLKELAEIGVPAPKPIRLKHVAPALIRAAVAASAGQIGRTAPEKKPDPAADFRRSDPALLGTTGRPQLVEFFHPT